MTHVELIGFPNLIEQGVVHKANQIWHDGFTAFCFDDTDDVVISCWSVFDQNLTDHTDTWLTIKINGFKSVKITDDTLHIAVKLKVRTVFDIVSCFFQPLFIKSVGRAFFRLVRADTIEDTLKEVAIENTDKETFDKAIVEAKAWG